MRRSPSGRQVAAPSGSWRLEARVAGDLNTQVAALLAKLPADPSTWRELSRHGRCDVFCGVFMREGNEGTDLTPEVLMLLGERQLHLGLDLYACS